MLERLEYFDLLHNQISAETQEWLYTVLPQAKVIMSAPCNCSDGQ
jgi:hypothetical protein